MATQLPWPEAWQPPEQRRTSTWLGDTRWMSVLLGHGTAITWTLQWSDRGLQEWRHEELLPSKPLCWHLHQLYVLIGGDTELVTDTGGRLS